MKEIKTEKLIKTKNKNMNKIKRMIKQENNYIRFTETLIKNRG